MYTMDYLLPHEYVEAMKPLLDKVSSVSIC